MINTNYVTVHDKNKVYRLIRLLFSLNTSRTLSEVYQLHFWTLQSS